MAANEGESVHNSTIKIRFGTIFQCFQSVHEDGNPNDAVKVF